MDSLNRNGLERAGRIPPEAVCPDATAIADGSRDHPPAPAPTNSALPLRPGRFERLTDALDYAAEGRTGCTFYGPRGQIETVLGFARLRDDAHTQARRLLGLGLRPGDRVGLVAETAPAFLTAFLGCVIAGLVPVPLPVPSACPTRDSYFRLISRQLDHCGASLFLRPDEPAFHGWQEPLGTDVPELSWSGLDGLPDAPEAPRGDVFRLAPPSPDDCCYIQYSSGSTSFPRGVAVTHRALLSNCRGIAAALALRADDRVATWLPLYHDMGLVGTFLAALSGQRSIDLMAPEAFARRPLLWLQLISRNRATISYGPCFAYDLCRSRTSAGLPPDLDLRSWRIAGVGGEMVSPDVMEAFAARFAPAGFRHTAVVASYGLAEATLGVTLAPLGHGLRTDAVDRQALSARGLAQPVPETEADARAGARILVRCGHALDGQAVRIAGPDGEALPARRVGRILVRGPGVMQGYFHDTEATRAVLGPDGWLDTGDVGYLCDGELVIVGRSKDTIIVHGRNIWPKDLEAVVIEALPDVRNQDCAAFGVVEDGGERAVVLIQYRGSDPDLRETLAAEVRNALRRAAGLDCRIVLVPPRSLPRTTSGKLSRSAARDLYLSGRLGSPGVPDGSAPGRR